MAGDWIKWTKGLDQKREVRAMANALGVHRLHIAGACMAVWSWADSETEDGNIKGISMSDIDDVSCVQGFAVEMKKNGWIRVTKRGISFPNFDRHNSQTSKARLLTNERVKRKRNAGSVTKALPEKRREEKSKDKEKKPPKSPKGDWLDLLPDSLRGSKEFVEAWKTWVQHRIEIRKELTPTSVIQQLKKLDKMGSSKAIEMILFTVGKGWQGLREPDDTPRGQPADIAAITKRVQARCKPTGAET